MNDVEILHSKAMEFAQEAVAARYYHDDQKAVQAFAEAFRWEAQAAAAIAPDLGGEPSRSVLHRSAAALALECGELRQAERLVCVALTGSPPEDIAQELRKLYDRVKMLLHYEGQGVVLSDNELELRLIGQGVGAGEVASNRIMPRIDAAQTLILRTSERLRGLDFRRRGRPKKAVRDECAFVLKAQPAASFGVALRLGVPKAQTSMALGGTPDEVIDETLCCLRLFNDSADDDLRARIIVHGAPDELYFTNFVSLARELEPDGSAVDAVAFTASRDGKRNTVVLTGRPDRGIFAPPPRTRDQKHEWVTLTGELVTARKYVSPGEGLIGLRDDSGKTHDVVVEEGMRDVVRSHWEDVVTIAGFRIKGRVHLSRLEEALFTDE